MKYRSWIQISMAVMTFACAFPAAAPAASEPVPIAFIEEQRQLVRQFQKQNSIPGLSVALFDHERIIWIEGFGRLSAESDRPVDANTIFGIQSISKTLTTVAVLTAVRDGLVDLDAPVTTYLPTFTINSCFEQKPETKITLRMMLGNTAGFTHEAPVGNNFDATFPSYQAHYRSISDTWLKFPAGTRYSYSNLGFDIAAHIIEKVSSLTFQDYMQRDVFEPMGMTFTAVDTAVIRANPDRSCGSAFGVTGFPLAVPMIGAGGVYTSAADLARFVQFHLNRGTSGGRTILDRKLLGEMYTPLIEDDYGLGIAIVREHGSYSFNHNGAGFGFCATMKWFPEYRIGCVILTNSTTEPYGTASLILDNAINAGLAPRDTVWTRGFDPFLTYHRTHPAGGPNVPWPSVPGATTWRDGWAKYLGTYRMNDGGGMTFSWYAATARWFGYKTPTVTIFRRGERLGLNEYNGSSSIGERPLTEYQSGLFFTAFGEALDFRTAVPTYRNIRLVK